MIQQQRLEIYQRRDALLAQLNYADEQEADETKRQIEAYNRELASEKLDSPIGISCVSCFITAILNFTIKR